MDHYAGPAKITQHIGTRSFLIEYKNAEGRVQTFQRDAGMLSLILPSQSQFDPDGLQDQRDAPHKHRSLSTTPLWEDEVVILKDGSEAIDWYCAQVIKMLPTHIVMHYLITTTPQLADYLKAKLVDRDLRILQATFLKTWCLNKGKGAITTIPPEGIREICDTWAGKIKISELIDQLLVRNVELSALGNLSCQKIYWSHVTAMSGWYKFRHLSETFLMLHRTVVAVSSF
jgi:hypothetical protein